MNSTIVCCSKCQELEERIQKLEKLFVSDPPKEVKEKYVDRPRDLFMVIQHFKEIKIKDPELQAEKFFNFYEAKGWMVGKNKIKKWKACVNTWDLPRDHSIKVHNAFSKDDLFGGRA
jgi:hypothetical protein